MAQSFKRPTLDVSSGLGLRVLSSSPTLDSTLGVHGAYLKKKERFTNYYTACKHTPIWVYSGTVKNTVTENYFDRCNDEKERRKGFMLEEVNDK